MKLEIERKFMHADLKGVRDKLRQAGATFLQRHFERNVVFDTADQSLRARNILLRLRQWDNEHDGLLTHKRPPDQVAASGYKIRHETETHVQDAAAMRNILGYLGYEPAFTYEKVREEWRMDACTVCLDRLPFGDCVEFEGDPEAIDHAAALLALPLAEGTDKNYHQLHQDYLRTTGRNPDPNFVFSPATLPPYLPWEE